MMPKRSRVGATEVHDDMSIERRITRSTTQLSAPATPLGRRTTVTMNTSNIDMINTLSKPLSQRQQQISFRKTKDRENTTPLKAIKDENVIKHESLIDLTQFDDDDEDFAPLCKKIKRKEPPKTPSKPARGLLEQNTPSAVTKDIANIMTPTSRLTRTPTSGWKTPSAARSPASMILQEAKSLFRRSSTPKRLVGRDNERQTIIKFWEETVFADKGGSLYISGVPGTGKTALVDEICKAVEPKFSQCPYKIHITRMNCMSVKEPRTIYPKLLELITGFVVDYKTALYDLEALFIGSGKDIHVVILDEIDHLLSRDQEVLYKLFQWPHLDESRLALIGIANALDLTERFLPRLKARDCTPVLLNFVPYQVNEITAIIKDRLGSLSLSSMRPSSHQTITDTKKVFTLMQPAAIEFAARKVVGSGDVRKALDVCRQALEVLETSLPDQRVMSPTSSFRNENFGSSSMDVDDMPKVTIQHISKAASVCLNSSSLSSASIIYDLNAHQKMVVAALIVCRKRNYDSTCEKVYQTYKDLLHNSMGLNAHPYSIFAEMIEGLVSNSLVNHVADGKIKKTSRAGKVVLAGDADHIEKTLLEGDTSGKLEDAMNGAVRVRKGLFD
ncbi:hypothetical protein SeMB42_g05192 [Synchytrium endobioticum]|uniref:Cell division control protein n=1 Tax=Synchytrium endobioticum TaxID=286115 RepID=A0A507CT89_9FUNG|nr:hypothetical protein SeMB42_g05192 [Synchytrium endobioticum]